MGSKVSVQQKKMGSKKDILGELISIGDPHRFVAKCYLYLSPEELKACRLVSTTWNEFILKDLWKEGTWGKGELRKKLVARWKTVEPVTEELNRVEDVWTMFSNETHVFCGFRRHGHVAVFNLSDGLLVKELTPSEVSPCNQNVYTKLSGADGIVAANMWNEVLAVWSTQPDKMEQLHCYNALNFQCPTCQDFEYSRPHSQVHQSTVAHRHKVAFLVSHGSKYSVVVLEKVGSTWVDKTLACFSGDFHYLASDSQWLAAVDESSKKLRLWDGDNSLPEVFLPGCENLQPRAISMEHPYIVASFASSNGLNTQATLIKVFKMVDSVPCLIKTVRFDNCARVFTENKSLIGFVQEGEMILVEKKELFSPQGAISRKINIEGALCSSQINATTIVLVRPETGDKGTELLMKKDFWMTNNIMET